MFHKHEYPDKVKKLFDAIHSIEDRDCLAVFLSDLLTPKELDEFATRWQVAIQLQEGKTQRQIASNLGCAVSTVSRVSTIKRYGTKGFDAVLSTLD